MQTRYRSRRNPSSWALSQRSGRYSSGAGKTGRVHVDKIVGFTSRSLARSQFDGSCCTRLAHLLQQESPSHHIELARGQCVADGPLRRGGDAVLPEYIAVCQKRGSASAGVLKSIRSGKCEHEPNTGASLAGEATITLPRCRFQFVASPFTSSKTTEAEKSTRRTEICTSAGDGWLPG